MSQESHTHLQYILSCIRSLVPPLFQVVCLHSLVWFQASAGRLRQHTQTQQMGNLSGEWIMDSVEGDIGRILEDTGVGYMKRSVM